MQDENLMKMSQIATPPLMDTHMANILICCLLDHLKKPVTPTQLYEIAVETEIINYFFYQESITYLQKWFSPTKAGRKRTRLVFPDESWRRMCQGTERIRCKAVSG